MNPLELAIANGSIQVEVYRPSVTNLTVQPTSNPTAGPAGPMGPSFLTISGTGDLLPALGDDGDYAVLTEADQVTVYGPKAAGVWSVTPTSTMPRGTGMLTISDPSELVGGFGRDGDYAVKVSSNGFALYGPKAGGAWSLTPVNVVAPTINPTAVRRTSFLFMGGS